MKDQALKNETAHSGRNTVGGSNGMWTSRANILLADYIAHIRNAQVFILITLSNLLLTPVAVPAAMTAVSA